MIRDEKTFTTQADAEAFGQHFSACWGYGYNGSHRVFQMGELWVCTTTRWTSCD